MAFAMADMPITWRGAGVEEVGLDKTEKVRVRIDPRYFRPAEVDVLQGDATYARKALGWKPTVSFKELVRVMVEADLALARQEGT
jgi:GDPmannose 4,6-dehydratase